MSAVIPNTAFNDMQTVRDTADRIGMERGKAIKEFIRSGYSRSYLNELSERARQLRMGGGSSGPEAA
ncbi:hypothetical protein [Xanthomonas citri]|uniref:hypothetical protein n=1 Tax=Xanthomonas citri TaxID=346 RepID=UPI000B5CD000|nr:hypothetical protein [Xanthomonas citri]ASL02171.1 hypothetical protein XcvCFBP7113P_19085 [Xanthomonas citri pv. vignicola]